MEQTEIETESGSIELKQKLPNSTFNANILVERANSVSWNEANVIQRTKKKENNNNGGENKTKKKERNQMGEKG